MKIIIYRRQLYSLLSNYFCKCTFDINSYCLLISIYSMLKVYVKMALWVPFVRRRPIFVGDLFQCATRRRSCQILGSKTEVFPDGNTWDVDIQCKIPSQE